MWFRRGYGTKSSRLRSSACGQSCSIGLALRAGISWNDLDPEMKVWRRIRPSEAAPGRGRQARANPAPPAPAEPRPSGLLPLGQRHQALEPALELEGLEARLPHLLGEVGALEPHLADQDVGAVRGRRRDRPRGRGGDPGGGRRDSASPGRPAPSGGRGRWRRRGMPVDLRSRRGRGLSGSTRRRSKTRAAVHQLVERGRGRAGLLVAQHLPERRPGCRASGGIRSQYSATAADSS